MGDSLPGCRRSRAADTTRPGRVMIRVRGSLAHQQASAADEESWEHEGRVATGHEPAWYELRLSALRQAILGTF